MHYKRPGVSVVSKSEGFHTAITEVEIPAGEIVFIWGGEILSYDALRALPSSDQYSSMQIADDLFIVTVGPHKAGPDYVNHSCEPNCGLEGQIVLRAMRDIAAGEEITCDYAISESTDMHEFDCVCGSVRCRGRFTGEDWKIPELQERYRGWMSPYLARKIAAGAR